MTTTGQATKKWTFTFGFGHVHPQTRERLANTYIQIAAADAEAARAEMVRRFGVKWAFQYESPERAGAAKYGLREIEG